MICQLRCACAAAALLLLASCADSTAPLWHEGAPEALSFTFGGYGASSLAVNLRGETVVVRRAPWDWEGNAVADSVVVVPTTEAWAEFWAAAETAGVHNWRSRYHAHVMDGVGWTLRLEAGGRTLESQGSNAFPDRHGREHEVETDAFRAFLDALGALVGQAL
jgi:hypothetical protein